MARMTESERAFEAYLKNEIAIGNDVITGGMFYVPINTLSQTHIHCVGPSGSGKTRWLMSLILQLVQRGLPFGILSPHRDLYDFAVAALRRSSRRPQDVIPFDAGDERFSVAFNPLQTGLADPADQASMVMESCLKAWGHASFDSTPRLERVLRSMFLALATNRLTLLEAYEFLNVDNHDFRSALLANVDDDLVRADWLEFDKLSRPDRLAIVESSRNRLQRFYQHPRVQRMIGQTENPLDLYEVMERGQILLANLGSLPSPESQRLLGSLLLGAIYHGAKRRDPKKRKTWFLVVDEAAQFVTPDLVNSLDEARKFGLAITIAHQRLRQLEREDSDLASALLTNAKVRIVFGGLERLEAERMAYELFAGEVRGDRVKHVSFATKFRPIQSTFEVETESWSDSEGETDVSTESDSSSDGESDSESASYAVNDDNRYGGRRDNDMVGRTSSSSVSHSSSRSSSASRGSSRSSTSGGSRSVVPVTVHEEFREETSRQFWSVSEEWEQRIGLVQSLPRREILFKLFDGPVHHLKTPDVDLDANTRATDQFKDRALTRNPHVKAAADVTRELAERKARIRELAESSTEAMRPFDVKSFREE
jgi:type IV secretion system coupling TraD/TrwB family protein